MMRSLALSCVVLQMMAAAAAAQAPGKAPASYDANAEVSYVGVVNSVIAVPGPDGTVGVHLSLKTATGTIVKVHLGPAMFIGMNDFFFETDEAIALRGAYVTHDGEVALWAREVQKKSKTLTLRGADGSPLWPFATTDDPDGCGVPHAPVHFQER